MPPARSGCGAFVVSWVHDETATRGHPRARKAEAQQEAFPAKEKTQGLQNLFLICNLQLMVGKDAENFDAKSAMNPPMDFEAWLRIGYENGWCGAPVCYIHDGLPTTAQEDEEWYTDSEPCMHIIRLYESDEHKRGVEENHSPSQWRASNRGLPYKSS